MGSKNPVLFYSSAINQIGACRVYSLVFVLLKFHVCIFLHGHTKRYCFVMAVVIAVAFRRSCAYVSGSLLRDISIED